MEPGVQRGGAVLGRELRKARSLDEVAAAVFAALIAHDAVTRVGLALTMAGGRQLRFVSSDRASADHAENGALRWCLIDAYDHLPLNDAVRTGHDVVLPDRRAFVDAYPALAERQGPGTQGVVALVLADGVKRLGGLLLYLDRELGFSGLATLGSGLDVELVRALRRLQTADDSVDELPPGHRLPADETAPALARQVLRQILDQYGVAEEGVDSALLCASEIVTNVVMHAARPSVLSVEADRGEVTVQVRHPAAAVEPPTETLDPVDPMEIAGRGLALVDAVAGAWGVEQEAQHTCWWFRIG